MRKRRCNGLTLVELVIIMAVSGIIFVTTPPLLFHGVKTMVFLPNALAVNQVATDVIHQIAEGGFSDQTLTGQTTIRGLRFAVQRSTTEAAVWLVEANRIGFRTSDGQYVIIRWDSTASVVKRGVVASASCPATNPSTEEIIPYQAQTSGVQILPTGFFFVYYDTSGSLVTPVGTGCPPTAIRRVDIAFTAQTGNGVFDQGNAQEPITSSVTIRVP